MSKRLTRKQIKEDIRHDEVQTAVSSTFEKIQSHLHLVIGLAVGLVVVAIAIAAVRSYLAHRDEKSALELAKAIKIHAAPIAEEGAQPDDPKAPTFATEDARRARTREAMEAIGGGPAEDVASLYLADLALAEGDKDAARGHWESFLADNDDHLLATSVRVNLIRLDREDGKAQEVAERLTAELDVSGKSLPEDVLLYELAQTLEVLERGDEAKDYYQRILDDHPLSPFASVARQKTTSS